MSAVSDKKAPTKRNLSFSSLRVFMSKLFRKIPDERQPNKIDYSLHDVLMSGFACMHFQDPSLLQFQKRLQDEQNSNNVKTLFDVENIPKNTQLREVIDTVDSQEFAPIFKEYYSRLQRGKHLEQYQLFPKQYYFPIDGSQFYHSKDIHCEQCLTKNHSNGSVSYSHCVLQGGIMHPDCPNVIPFMPEQICNSDGNNKQDCEMNAAKRFIEKATTDFPRLGFIFGGDSLLSRQPIIQQILSKNQHYLFVAKPGDHKYLMEWIDAYDKLHKVTFVDEKDRTHIYEWMNDVPLHGGKESINVNFIRCRIIGTDKNGLEKNVYTNSWVTDLLVSNNNIVDLVRGGRCRWKVENEVFNVMKNDGYCMEKNFGHGDKNLCFNFYLLTLLAFLMHQIFELTDGLYKKCRKKFGSKRHMWEKLRSYVCIIIFDTWECLLEFALKPTKYKLSIAASP